MHGVAAKIAEEIRMLFQHHDIDPGAAEQIAQHHAGRSAADDAAADFHVSSVGPFRGSASIHGSTFLNPELSDYIGESAEPIHHCKYKSPGAMPGAAV